MREVRAWVSVGGRVVASVEPFAVESPWWADVEPVNRHLENVLGVRTWVLRLLATTGEGGRDGVVTYLVEARGTPDPARLLAGSAPVLPDSPHRMPWARPGGVDELVTWADRHVRRTGPAVQVRTWNLSCLLRLPTAAGTVWVKALPPFASDEAAAIRCVAAHDSGLVPEVLAEEPGRLLLADVPGQDGWDPAPELVAQVVPRMVAVQAALADGPPRAVAREGGLHPDFGLPTTLVHGDFHPGNWRSSGVVLDWADAHWGHPALDAARLCEYTAPDQHAWVRRVWSRAWRQHRPGSDPGAALEAARPVAHLLNAARYQEFLDNIEDSERPYHESDPEAERERARAAGGTEPVP